jgi:hypothetical protein
MNILNLKIQSVNDFTQRIWLQGVEEYLQSVDATKKDWNWLVLVIVR